MKYISFFSGALGLDIGLERCGFLPLLFCESDNDCQKTISLNKKNIPIIGDIRNYHPDDIRKITNIKNDIDLIVGGPPCQSFSTAGKRKYFSDERGNVFIYFIEMCISLKPKYIVIENVRGLISAYYNFDNNYNKKGTALEFIKNSIEKEGYSVSFNLYNSANYGVPQIRERLILIATLNGGKLPYLNPTHDQHGKFGLEKWVPIKNVINDLSVEKNKYCEKFPEKRLKYYRLLKNGENWKNLPEDLQREALGKSFDLGGGKTGFLRRLNLEKPSPTLVTSPIMPATDLAHPTENRPLSVAEYARIQQFPDNWIFSGSIKSQYKQIGNAIPCGLGEKIAEVILNRENGKDIHPPDEFKFSRYKNTNENNWLNNFK